MYYIHFTFQSGSIQISHLNQVQPAYLTLHSNLVLFKLKFLLKSCLNMKKLYIPIWFYSNNVVKIEEKTL